MTNRGSKGQRMIMNHKVVIAMRVVEMITCLHIIAGVWRHWGV